MFRIYVGNLPYSVDKTELAEIFSGCGTVTDTAIPLNHDRRPKGFAFVEFETKEAMDKAIAEFDQKEVGGRVLRVNEARPREDRDTSGSAPKEDAPAKEAEAVTDEAPSEATEAPAEDAGDEVEVTKDEPAEEAESDDSETSDSSDDAEVAEEAAEEDTKDSEDKDEEDKE